MSDLALVFYRVKEMQFKIEENAQAGATFKIKPKIECKLAQKNDNIIADLILNINNEISSPLPFELKVNLTGVFKSSNGVNKQSVSEIFTILYPYLRSVVSIFTSNCNIPAYVLPLVATEKILEDEEKLGNFIIKKPDNLN